MRAVQRCCLQLLFSRHETCIAKQMSCRKCNVLQKTRVDENNLTARARKNSGMLSCSECRLDSVRPGWGAKFGLTFEQIGCDVLEDVIAMEDDDLEDIKAGLQKAGAKKMHMRKMLKAPPHNYSSSFPAGVHAPEFRLSAKMIKVKGCAWLDVHQPPERSHSQRISNRGESYITFSLSMATSG